MSTNRTHIDASPAAVFAVLSDVDSYEHWVVGSSSTFKIEGNWPEVGATFHHRQGVPLIGPKDTTSVLQVDAPRMLKLCVRVRPYMVGVVTMTLTAADGGTDVTMEEEPVGGFFGRMHNPVFDAGLHLRNIESLRRLKNLAKKRQAEFPASGSGASPAPSR